MTEGKFQPAHPGEHSIQEAVITLNLLNEIVKPHGFESLIQSQLKEDFQKFETISQVQVQIRPGNSPSPEIRNQPYLDAGFRFLRFEAGKVSHALQGLNDIGNNRRYYSFHSMSYKRWHDFSDSAKKYFTALNGFQTGNYVTSVGVHYIDRFDWIGSETPLQLSQLFNANSKHIPMSFFDGNVQTYSIVTENKSSNKNKFNDRLEITVTHEIKPNVLISHYNLELLNEEILLQDFLNGDIFSHNCDHIHLRNKDVLKDILTEEFCRQIHLIL